MSYPMILWGPEGHQFEQTSGKRWPFGTQLHMQDGRQYRYFQAGGSAIATARLVQSAVPGANFDQLAVPTATVVGQRAMNITNGATTITLDQFAEGYLNVEDDTGEGHLYKIDGNDAESAGSAAFEVRLSPGNGLVVAWTTATTVGLTANPFDAAIIHPSPNTACLLGVTCRAMTADYYGWLQTRGPASVLTEGTVVIGQQVIASSSTDGAVTPAILTEGTPNTFITPFVGFTMEVAATTEQSLIWLRLG